MVKSIPLTRGLSAVVDDEDYDALVVRKWCTFPAGGKFYAVHNLYTPGRGQRHLYMHTAILGLLPGHSIDHIDGDGLNNRRSNLRFATCAENNRNRRKGHGTTSAFKGVSWQRTRGLWRAGIETAGKTRHLGYFADESAAARAYDEAARLLFGAFARLNFPD